MNILRFLPALLYLCSSGLLVADLATAERLLRDGKAAAALEELQLIPHSPAVQFWKGRALVELNRLPQAVQCFREVPPDSAFFPYAGKALIYCAWQSPQLDFVEYVAPLTASTNRELATLAQAALAEHQLKYTTRGDVSTLTPLRELAEEDPSLQPMVTLLNIEEMRRQHRFDHAIQACRAMEAAADVPLITKQRVRLTLAEIYYDKAAAESAATQPQQADEDLEDNDEGKGEETLLHFISANPDSPLLEEAFRRLDHHKAFDESEYARRKLIEWSHELSKPRRAALALAVLQSLQLKRPAHESEDATLTNTAANELPNEPVSQLIIREQIRRLIHKGRFEQASLYLNLLTSSPTDPRYLFYKACCMPHTDPATVDMFLKSAELAPADLQPVALCNAMFCAVKSGSQSSIDYLLTKELPTRARRALLLTHAGLILKTNPAQARAEIESAALLSPTEAEQIEITLQLAELDIEIAPAATLERLSACTPEEQAQWTEEQALRRHSLMLQAAESLQEMGEATIQPIELLEQAVATAPSPEVKAVLTIYLAHRLSEARQHTQAMELLLALAERATDKNLRARAQLLAARQAEKHDSLEQLSRAAELFAAAAEFDTPYRNRALMLRARVLAWINRGEEARQILTPLLKSPDLPPTELALALSIEAHCLNLEGTPEGLQSAIESNQKIFDIKELPNAWLTRARIQKATLLARSGQRENALAEYYTLLDEVVPPQNALPSESQWFILYFSAAGAIAQHLELGQYREAADLADRVAAWPKLIKPGEKHIGIGARAQQFANWAENIRKFNFVPSGATSSD